MSQPRSQTLPFLHRNWRAAVDSLEAQKMQATFGDDDHYARPAKRRRRHLDSPGFGFGPDVDAFVLHEDPVDTSGVMRIDVLKISHKDDASRTNQNPVMNGSVPAVSRDLVSKARCTITVTTPKRTHGNAQILYCDSQTCSIRTMFNAAGACRVARVYLTQPFLVPEDKLFVRRDDDPVRDFADTYAVRIDLSSASDDNWPPLNLDNPLLESDIAAARTSPLYWTLTAEVSNVLDRGRRAGALRLDKGFPPSSKTSYVVDIDVRWATSLPRKTVTNTQDQACLADPVHAEAFDEALVPTNGNANGTNGNYVNGNLSNGHLHLVEDDMEEDAEGELTPSRSLRARASKNYNLKDLSAKAQGRQPRKRVKITELQKADSDLIVYRLPREAVPIKEVILGAFSCCVCFGAHQSLAQLRAHLLCHAQYSFDVSHTPGKSGHQLDVSYVGDNLGVFLRTKIYSLGKPTKAFDLDRYVEGDESWVFARLGPNNQEDKLVTAPRKVPQPKASRAAYRNVVRPKQYQPPPPQQKRKVYVPDTQTPLFDPLSKSRLIPGTEVREMLPDDGWLIQKHRDIVQDFCDVDSSEKEYIKEWDAFIQRKRIVSEAFIGRALAEFVVEKVDWLLESQSRTLQFGKHLTVLVARGVDDDIIRQVQARLRDARIQRLSAQRPAIQPPKETPRRNSKGCGVCGKLVRGPSLRICDNEDCARPLYHDRCIRAVARMPVEQPYWRCNNCTH